MLDGECRWPQTFAPQSRAESWPTLRAEASIELAQEHLQESFSGFSVGVAFCDLYQWIILLYGNPIVCCPEMESVL